MPVSPAIIDGERHELHFTSSLATILVDLTVMFVADKEKSQAQRWRQLPRPRLHALLLRQSPARDRWVCIIATMGHPQRLVCSVSTQ